MQWAAPGALGYGARESGPVGKPMVGKWVPVHAALTPPTFCGVNEMVFNVPPNLNHSMILWSSKTQTAHFGRAARPTFPDCTRAMCSLLELSSSTAKLGSAGCETPAPPGSERIQRCCAPPSAPRQISLDIKPHLLAQTHPLELLSTTQLEGCQQHGHHSSCSF